MAPRSVLALLIVLAFLLPPVLAQGTTTGWPAANGWPEYGGTVKRTGYAPVAGPDKVLEAAKPAPLKGPSFSAPIADSNGDLYVGDDTGVVTKLSPTLQKLWESAPLGGPIRSSLSLGPGNTLFVAPVGPDLVALDASTGDEKWRYAVNNGADSGYALTAAPGVHPQGFVVQPSMDGNFYAVTFDGTKKWGPVGGATDKCVAAPAIATDGTIYAGCQDGLLRAIKADGTIKWTLPLRGTGANSQISQNLNEQQVAAPTIGADGTIYVTTRVARALSGSVYSITDGGAAGTIVWRRALNEKATSPVTLDAKGGLYIGDLSGDFFKLNAATGAIEWTFSPGDDDPDVYDETGATTPTIQTLSVAEQAVADAAGHVYVTYWHVDLRQGFPPQESFASPFYALNTADGAIVWREIFSKTTRSPLLAPSDTRAAGGALAGVLYLAGDDGNVYARATVPPTAGAPSPTAVPSSASVAGETATTAANLTEDTAGTTSTDTPGPTAGWAFAILVAVALGVSGRRHRRNG